MRGQPWLDGEMAANAGAGLSLEVDENGIAVLEFDQPDAEHNRFTPELLERFSTLVGDLRRRADDGEVRGLVLASGKRDSFIVGMDVAAIAGVRSPAAATAGARQGQLAFDALADLPVTKVAAINGTCLGGATELALACDYRLAADSTAVEIGLPEVTLGIFPGFGGSQRLPRLIALERALPMILQGGSLTVERARRQGLVDAVVPVPLLLQVAREWARERAPRAGRVRAPEDRGPLRRARRFLIEGNPVGRALLFAQAAKRIRASTGGRYPAPVAALETVRRGLRLDLDEALRLEAQRVGELAVSPEARNLMGIFFLRQAARRLCHGQDDAEPRRVRRVGVLGAGVMGGGIAQLVAYQGLPVRLKDIALGPLEEAMGIIHRRLQQRRRRGKLDARGVRRRVDLVSPTLEYTGFRHADLVIEAVVERVDVKHQVLSALESAVGADTVLATNTSSLTVAELATCLERPGRLVGLHFFNPVHRMQLVEVVRGPASDPRAVATAAAFAVSTGKVPVVVGDAPGFFVNRVLTPYINEALLMLREGASIGAIDGALEGFGMPMGPIRLLDEVGLDISAEVADRLAPVLGDRIPRDDATRELLDGGRTGRKGGAGFYRYPQGGEPEPDPEIEERLAGAGDGPDRQRIVARCILVMLNEAARTLQEGIVSSPQAADLALILGTGFAPFRGGLFRHVESEGTGVVVARMRELAQLHGERFEPSRWLLEREGSTFYPPEWPEKIDTIDTIESRIGDRTPIDGRSPSPADGEHP